MGDPITLTLNKAKTIDQLYEEVKDHDLILTVDAPLADALNARLSEPRLGHFATTPRRLALSNLTGENIIEDKRELFLKMIDKTDLGWKHAAYLLQNITSCWKETGYINDILSYQRFNSEETKQMIDILQEGINLYSALTKYRVPKTRSTAVIALHQFTELDKKVLPDKYDTVEIFTDKTHNLSHFNIFNSTTEIIQAIMDNIDDPKDAAVVMKEESPYRHLLEATFRTEEIPYMVSQDFKDDEDLRTYIKLVRFGLSKRGLQLKDVRPILYHFDISPSIEKDEFYLYTIEDKNVQHLKELLDKIPSLTFEETIDEYESILQKDQEELRKHIEILNLTKEPITEENLNSFKYYLESFDITTKSAGRGVLFASPASSTYIDRSSIFYLGMDTSWTPEAPSNPWVKKEEFDEKNIKNFKIILQNGEQQHFLVQNKTMNQHVTPSYYLNEFTDEEIEKFTDFHHTFYRSNIERPQKPFEEVDYNIKPKETKLLSKSALNVLAYCPKDYFFNRLVDGPDKVYFKKGHLLHHFAEFYINYPDFVEKQREDDLVELMMEGITPYIDHLAKSSWDTQFRIGIQNLKKYLKPKEKYEELPGYERRPYNENMFAEHFGKLITKQITEARFDNIQIGAKGVVDLINDRDHIIDHKSGKKSTIGKIMRLSDIYDLDKKPRFQAKMYLAHHRTVVPDEHLRFSFFHILDNIKDVLSGTDSVGDNILDIHYYPKPFNDMIQEKEIYHSMIDGVAESNYRRRVLETIGYDSYRKFFKDNHFPDGDKNEVLDEPVLDDFIKYCQNIFGKSPKYITTGCKSAFKKLVKFRDNNYFKDDIDEFEIFLNEYIDKLNEYKRTEFPIYEEDKDGKQLHDIDVDELENKDLVIL